MVAVAPVFKQHPSHGGASVDSLHSNYKNNKQAQQMMAGRTRKLDSVFRTGVQLLRGSTTGGMNAPALLKLAPYVSRPVSRPLASMQARSFGSQAVDAKPEPTDEPVVVEICMKSKKKVLSVKWLNGTRTDFPYVWLRDNCQCPKCYHPTSKARLFLMQNLDLDVEPRHAEILDSGDICLVWPTGHTSRFSANWLRQHDFTQQKRTKRNMLYENDKQLWTARSIKNNLPKGDFHEMMKSNEALYNFLFEFRKYGIGIVENMGGRGAMLRFCNRIAFERKTHYGDMFEVKTKIDPSNLTYTSASLGLHTDLTYYDYQPGIQMLHCLQQAEGYGGDNGFVDAFKVGYTVKENRPDLYNILTKVPLDNWDVGSDTTDFYKLYKSPVIRLDENNKIWQIRYNNQVRDSFMDMDSNMVRPMYEALKEFDDTCYDPELTIKHKLKSAEMVVFDNWRVLHSRYGYSADTPTQRELEGGFMDWDEIHSSIRVLDLKIKHGEL